MPVSPDNRTVLVIGRNGGIARSVALAVQAAGGDVVLAGRSVTGSGTQYVDLTDEDSIAALASRFTHVDHIVSTASARARGAVPDLDHATVLVSFNVKKSALFESRSATNPVRRIGTADDIASAVLFALTNTFLTGVTLSVDGGDPLV
jgi:NAD(P)-dependent dehydrogenase (short-subunit alcohol dehydrogenase family)